MKTILMLQKHSIEKIGTSRMVETVSILLFVSVFIYGFDYIDAAYLLPLVSVTLAGFVLYQYATGKKEQTLTQEGDVHFDELSHLYFYDTLTDIKNRISLENDLKEQPFYTVYMIDIDAFQTYNEIYGQEGANKLLQVFASTLKEFAKQYDYEAYRINGDVFMLRATVAKEDRFLYEIDIKILLHKLNTLVIDLDGQDEEVDIDVTIGVSYEKENALPKVNMALNDAKAKHQYLSIYDNTIDSTKTSENMLFWKHEIKHALSTDNIVPVYQPIVNKAYATVKYEVLMRLRQENEEGEKLVSPFFFLDIAMKTKLYDKLTEQMIQKSFRMMSKLGSDFSINLSFEDMKNEKTMQLLYDDIKKHDLGGQLILEIVESESVTDYAVVKGFITRFRSLGVRIAIDDFGSGFSNYTHILEIMPDFLKIDGSLIKDIDTNENSYKLVKSLVQLAQSLGIKTIAEFVHNEAVLNVCQALDIDEFQGYHFSPPLEEKDINAS